MKATRWAVAAAMAVAMFGLRPAAAAAPGDFLAVAPATHEGFGYFDCAQARTTSIYQELKPILFDENAVAGFAFIEQLTGMKLPDDLEALAVSGKAGPKKTGALYVRGKFDKARIINFISMNPQYTKTERNGDTIHGFLDEKSGNMTYLLFLADDFVVFGTLPSVEEVLATARGKAPALAANPTMQARIAGLTGKPVLLGIGVRPAQTPPELQRVPFKIDVQSALIAVFAEPETLRAVARVEGGSPEYAGQLRDIAEGFVAAAELQTKAPKLAELARRVTFAQQGNVVEAEARVGMAEATAHLRQAILKKRGIQPASTTAPVQ